MKFTPIYAIKPKSTTEVDILLYGVIGQRNKAGDIYNGGKQFVTDFNALEKQYTRINVRINSPGGSVHEGLPIVSALQASKNDIHTYNDGIAYSMGAFILLSGKTVHAAANSITMLHNASGIAAGNAQDMRTAADEMDVYDEVLTQIVSARSGQDVAHVKANWMNYRDNMMTAAKAFANKLVDVVETYDTQPIPDNLAALNAEEVFAFYEPAAKSQELTLLKRIAAILDPKTTITENQKTMFGNKFAKLTALKDVLAKDLTEAQVAEVNAEIVAAGIEGVTAVLDSELETYTGNATALGSEIATLTASLTDKDAVIAAHVKEIAALKVKLAAPAASASAPPTSADPVIAGTDANGMEAYMTTVDREVQAMRAEMA